MKLDHVAIAVPTIAEGLALYAAGLGLEHVSTEVVAEQQVTVAKLAARGTTIELLEPLVAGEGPVGAFLAKRGPGIHHLCFSVPDVRAAAAAMVAQGFQTVTEEPKSGADGCEVIFLHPKSALGTLIELSQPPATEDA